MKYKKQSINGSIQHITIAVIAGIAIGAVIGTLSTSTKGRAFKGKILDFTKNLINEFTGNTRVKANIKLGNVITDVSNHIKLNAADLLG